MKNLNYKEMGMRIRKARLIKGYTQETFAELTGISASFVGHIERAEKIPSVETLACISRTLEESIDYIVFGNLLPEENLYNDIQSVLQKYQKQK